MSSNTFYVAITRCKEEVGVYTDDAEKLREMVKKDQHKESTLDYTMAKTDTPNQQKEQEFPTFELPRPTLVFNEGINKIKQAFNTVVNAFKTKYGPDKEHQHVSIED